MEKLLEYYSNRNVATEQKIDNIVSQANGAVVELSGYLNMKKRDNSCAMATISVYVDRLRSLLAEYNREEATRVQLSDFCLSVKLRMSDNGR